MEVYHTACPLLLECAGSVDCAPWWYANQSQCERNRELLVIVISCCGFATGHCLSSSTCMCPRRLQDNPVFASRQPTVAQGHVIYQGWDCCLHAHVVYNYALLVRILAWVCENRLQTSGFNKWIINGRGLIRVYCTRWRVLPPHVLFSHYSESVTCISPRVRFLFMQGKLYIFRVVLHRCI